MIVALLTMVGTIVTRPAMAYTMLARLLGACMTVAWLSRAQMWLQRLARD